MSNSDLTLHGALLDDPELRFTAEGKPVAKLVIMVSERWKDSSGEWKNGETSFVTCNAWDQMAEGVAEGLKKHDQVLATGKLEQRKYETKDGEKRSSWEVRLSDIGPSLKWKKSSGFDDSKPPF